MSPRGPLWRTLYHLNECKRADLRAYWLPLFLTSCIPMEHRCLDCPGRDDLLERLTRHLIETLPADGTDRRQVRVHGRSDPNHEAPGVRAFGFNPVLG